MMTLTPTRMAGKTALQRARDLQIFFVLIQGLKVDGHRLGVVQALQLTSVLPGTYCLSIVRTLHQPNIWLITLDVRTES